VLLGTTPCDDDEDASVVDGSSEVRCVCSDAFPSLTEQLSDADASALFVDCSECHLLVLREVRVCVT
jgi:hypothetical protein